VPLLFCLTKNKLNSYLAIAMSSAISSKLGSECSLVIREKINSWCSQVVLDNNTTTGDFRDYRNNSVHPSVLLDDTGTEYYNIWCGHNRGSFTELGFITQRSITKVTQDILSQSGCRKRIDISDVMYSSDIIPRGTPLATGLLSTADRNVCVVGDVLSYANARQIAGACSVYHWFFQFPENVWLPNYASSITDEQLRDAIEMSDYVVVNDVLELLPYFRLLNNKTIIAINKLQHISDIHLLDGITVDYVQNNLTSNFLGYINNDK